LKVRVPSGLAEKKALRNRPKIRKLTGLLIDHLNRHYERDTGSDHSALGSEETVSALSSIARLDRYNLLPEGTVVPAVITPAVAAAASGAPLCGLAPGGSDGFVPRRRPLFTLAEDADYSGRMLDVCFAFCVKFRLFVINVVWVGSQLGGEGLLEFHTRAQSRKPRRRV